MKKIWFDEAWDDYLYWQTQDKKTACAYYGTRVSSYKHYGISATDCRGCIKEPDHTGNKV